MAKETKFLSRPAAKPPSHAAGQLFGTRPFAPPSIGKNRPTVIQAFTRPGGGPPRWTIEPPNQHSEPVESMVRRAPVTKKWNTRNSADKDAIVEYMKGLYRSGRHEAIYKLKAHIANDGHKTSQFFLDFIDSMMQYGGLNRFVQNVAEAGGEQNFAQGFVRVYGPDDSIIYRQATDAQGSGEEEEKTKSEEQWHTVKKDKKDDKVSLRDSEAAVCDGLYADIQKDAKKIESPARAEIHLVTNNGPCDACKDRINLLAQDIQTALGGEIHVAYRIYYLKPPKKKTRGKKEVETTYGWMEDVDTPSTNDQGLYTHDGKV